MKKQNTARARSKPPTAKKKNPKEFQYAYVVEAFLLLALMGGGTLFTMQYLKRQDAQLAPAPRPLFKIPGVLEAETLPILEKSRDFIFRVQDMTEFREGNWSGNSQYYAADTRPGDWVDLGLPDGGGGFRLTAYFTKASDYGTVRVWVNGAAAGPTLDLFSGGPVLSTGPVDLGTVKLKARANRLRIEVVGVNERVNPKRYFFGIDAVRLSPI